MATIIPSSHIYATPEHSLVPKNKIAYVDANANDMVIESGNLAEPLVMTFYRVIGGGDDSQSPISFEFVGDNPKYNPYGFQLYVGDLYKARLNLFLDKISDFTVNYPQNISNYKVRSRKIFKNVLNETLEIENLLDIEEYAFIENYDYSDETFIFDYSTVVKRVDDYFLVTETLSLEGTYYSPKSSNISAGDSTALGKYSIPSNELLQVGSKIGALQTPYYQDLMATVLYHYKSGKNTAVIQCSFGDYYDEDGTLAVSPTLDKMSFDLHDIVIPYIYRNRETPLSLDKYGNAQKYEIVGIQFTNKGCPWQILSLQEYK